VVIAEEWKEVIPMAAVLGRKQAQPLIAELVSRGEALKREYLINGNFSGKDEWVQKLPAPVSRLVQCLIEEAEVPQQILGQALSLVSFFGRGCHSPENWEALSRGPYGEELIHQALVIYSEMDWPRETWVQGTVARLSALSQPISQRLCAEGVAALKTLIASPDEKSASFGLLTLCGLLISRSEGTIENLLPLLPQIEKSVMLPSAPIAEAASWAFGLVHVLAGEEGETASQPSPAVLDNIFAAWAQQTGADTVFSFALASALLFPRGAWQPEITGSVRLRLRSYLKTEQHHRDAVAAGLIGFHAGEIFSDRELVHLLRSNIVYMTTSQTQRIRAVLESSGLTWDDDRSRSSARNRSRTRKSA
jgi:hypothetical protein